MINIIDQQDQPQQQGWLQRLKHLSLKVLKAILFIKDPYTLKQLCRIAEQIEELEENQSAEKIGEELSHLPKIIDLPVEEGSGIKRMRRITPDANSWIESDAFQAILWDDFIKRQEICLEIYNDLEHIIASLQKMKEYESAQKAAIKVKAIYLEILRWYMVNNLEGVQSIPNYDRLIDKYGDIKDAILEVVKN